MLGGERNAGGEDSFKCCFGGCGNASKAKPDLDGCLAT